MGGGFGKGKGLFPVWRTWGGIAGGPHQHLAVILFTCDFCIADDIDLGFIPRVLFNFLSSWRPESS